MTGTDGSLRLQLVTTSMMGGGAEVQVLLLAKELKRRGHAVEVVSMRDPEAFEDEFAAADIPFHSLGMRRGAADPRAVLRHARLVRAFQPHVVHSHMVHANLLARVTRLLAPFPVQISTAHNLTEGARWREVAYRLTDPLSDLTTNVCKPCVERFVEVGAAPAGRIRYMPNGLEFKAFEMPEGTREAKRAELGVDGRTFLWLAVGRLEEQKDFPGMIEAVAELSRIRPGADFKVVVAGEGHLAESLRARAVDLGLADRFELIGVRTDVPALMAAADGYLMSSAWEGLPMVLLEAAAARLPAVVTDVGGNAEVVRHQETGLVVPPHDFAALADAMSELSMLPSEARRAMGENARQHAERAFGIEGVVDRWETLYRELLAKKGRTQALGRADAGGPA